MSTTLPISTQLQEDLRSHFETRLAWQTAQDMSPLAIGTTQAALDALGTDQTLPIIGALVCDMTDPCCVPLHAEKAAELREQLLTELDEKESASA